IKKGVNYLWIVVIATDKEPDENQAILQELGWAHPRNGGMYSFCSKELMMDLLFPIHLHSIQQITKT
ncbi:MAG: hypothetical protein AAFU67_10610, partial [Bacteroidota bacterium]